MTTAIISVAGRIVGEPGGQLSIGPLFATSTSSNWVIQYIELASGTNTITVPTSPATTGVIIILPTDNTYDVTLKGVAGDTGVKIGKVKYSVLTWDPTSVPASFVLSSAGAQTGKPTQIIFF